MGVSLPGGGGKRGLDFEINLVPFIDLLSCLISFLLVTAVWTQLGRIDLTQPPPSNQPAELPPEEPKKVKILVDKAGYYIHIPTEDAPRRIAIGSDGTYKAWELEDALAKMRKADLEITRVSLSAEDDSKYKQLITVLDICQSLGLKDLSMVEPDSMREVTGAGGVPVAPPTP